MASTNCYLPIISRPIIGQCVIGASLYLGTLVQSQCDTTDRLTDRHTNIDLVWIVQHGIDRQQTTHDKQTEI